MKIGVGLGILILFVMLMVSPVAACHLLVTTEGQKKECTTCDLYTYTIHVKSVARGVGDTNYLVEVKDILPDGIQFVSYTDNGPVPETADCVDPSAAVLNANCRILRWSYNEVPHNAEWTITLNVKPIGKTDGNEVTNLVRARLKPDNGDSLGGLVSASSDTVFEDDICPVSSPEFPTLAVPAGLIVGILGAVLFIQRSKEN
jgi:hypothetical protein